MERDDATRHNVTARRLTGCRQSAEQLSAASATVLTQRLPQAPDLCLQLDDVALSVLVHDSLQPSVVQEHVLHYSHRAVRHHTGARFTLFTQCG